MKSKLYSFLFFFLLILNIIDLSAQNLIDTSHWTIGSENLAGFQNYGSNQENIRISGNDHVGNDVILWLAIPDGNTNADGGWITNNHPIDPTKTYRFSVWLKKINSNSGTSYFGCQSFFNQGTGSFYCIENLNGTTNTNPFFWLGDLPELNKWYFLVAYVYDKNYGSSMSSFGSNPSSNAGIYDGKTGRKISTVTNFKFSTLAETISHRAILKNDGNTVDRQYFYAPRIDLMNGSEPSIRELLALHKNPKLAFGYDNAMNQSLRVFSNLPPIIQPSTLTKPDDSIALISTTHQQIGKGAIDNELSTKIVSSPFDQLKITVYPNPVKQIIHIQISKNDIEKIEEIYLFDENGKYLKRISAPKNPHLIIDFVGLPSGVYFLNILLNNGNLLSKKILKE